MNNADAVEAATKLLSDHFLLTREEEEQLKKIIDEQIKAAFALRKRRDYNRHANTILASYYGTGKCLTN